MSGKQAQNKNVNFLFTWKDSKMKLSKLKIMCIILSCIWMAVIFCFSARDADESEKDSYRVGLAVGKIIIPDFEQKAKDEQLVFAKKIDYPVRKAAHATEYAILGILVLGVLYSDKNNKVKNISIPLIVCIIYASTDELHQLFVPGRSGKPFDVMIDGCGAFVGITLTLVIISIIKKRLQRHEQ